MPSFITHNVFAYEVKNKYNLKVNNLYYIFAQSHDFLVYSTNKEVKTLSHYAHTNNTRDYIINIIKYIKDNNLTKNIDLISYLYGSITHYLLDSTTHPFLFYKSGIYNKNDKYSYKYKDMHRLIEKNIDSIYYKNYYKKEYNYCNVSKDFIKKINFSSELSKCIDYSYYETYKKNNISKYYLKSIKLYKFIFYLLFKDRFGIKRFIYNIIDKLFNTHISSISTYLKNPNKSYLNLNHKKWNHPSNIDIKYNDSFEDLFKKSIFKFENIYKNIKLYFNNKLSLDELKQSIPNISYTSGLNLDKNKRMKYFEY